MKTPKKTPKKTLAKFAFAPALICAAALPIGASALAGEADAPILVTSQEEMRTWQKSTTLRLNRALARVPQVRNGAVPSGVVQIRFTLDEDGRPTDLDVISNSASPLAKGPARQALRRIGDLSDVPVSAPEEAQFLANIVFAKDQADHRELLDSLEASERARIAAGGLDYIVLGG